ncbi:MAG: PIN domain-containing protein [Acidobacteriota bacterium]|nr:PIN domain-containing protein [Acidobacteriota bacterium]
MGLIDDVGPGDVGIDTALFIYLIEEDPRFLATIDPLFADAERGKRDLVTSALTLLEVLVVPYRSGNGGLASRYEALLLGSRGIRVSDITNDQLRAASQLRAATGVKTPDALQLAAALSAGCSTFVTNDRRLPDIPGLRVLQLSAYSA